MIIITKIKDVHFEGASPSEGDIENLAQLCKQVIGSQGFKCDVKVK